MLQDRSGKARDALLFVVVDVCGEARFFLSERPGSPGRRHFLLGGHILTQYWIGGGFYYVQYIIGGGAA